MNSLEAKRILMGHRAGRPEADDPQLEEALQQARRDPALREWLDRQQSFHAAMETRLRQLPVPDDLRGRILARQKTVRFPRWRRTAVYAAAAAAVLLIGLAALWFRPAPGEPFTTFRSRMVGSVLRQYRMDITTNDLAEIRRFLGTNTAPADFVVPQVLAAVPAAGAGVLSWQGRPVSMVCFDGDKDGTLFLFIADGTTMKQLPGEVREYAQVSKLMTVSWTQAGRVYVLAGAGGKESLRRNP